MHPRLDRMPRSVSTGHLLADCERWCRDNLPPRTPLQPRALRSVPTRGNVRSLRAAARGLSEGTRQRRAS